MSPPYEIHPYDINTLKGIFVRKSGALPSVVDNKLHTTYFKDYFKDLEAATILVENDYVDRDFMEDYAGFYARCFGKYDSSATRLHFFDRSFTSRQLHYLMIGRGRSLTIKHLQDAYLGFVVIKQLPQTFIGRTCLRTYGSDNGRRFYPTLRRYPVGLFGLTLEVPKTLAFQEQDRGAAACATSALWTIFQGTGKLYQHAIPPQVEITRLATQIPDEEVPGFLPSRGLTGRQEIYAIRQLGLEVDHTNAQDLFNMMGSVYAYLRAGIPLLLRISLYDVSNKKQAENIGGHAVAVTGFSLGRDSYLPYGSLRFNLRATRIDKIYVHDDQVGPFAKMNLDLQTVIDTSGAQNLTLNSLSTSWRGQDGKIGSVRAVPRFHLIPLYPKIRLRFKFIREVVMSFDKFVREALFGPKDIAKLESPFEWDIYLTTVNKVKASVYVQDAISSGDLKEVLLSNMPRFLWRAQMRYDTNVLLELLFDATDIEQGKFFLRAVRYDKPFFSFLIKISQSAVALPYYQSMPYFRIIDWFALAKP